MAQARKIKKQIKKPKSKPKNRSGGNVPWGLLLVILLCGVVVGVLLKGSLENDTGFGSGLKTLFANKPDTIDEDKQLADLLDRQTTEKDFDFYEILPEIERVMPDDLPESVPDRVDTSVDYFIQAASFRQHADAEKLRARLALKGFKSVTQAREVEGKGTFYRVRLGPFADKRKAKTMKNRLKKLGAHGFIFTVKKQ